MLSLPTDLRDAFKEPLGPVYTDADALLADADDDAGRRHDARAEEDAGGPHAEPDALLVAVGDVVTYHLREAGREPDVALIDGKTEREEVAAGIRRALADAGDRRFVVENTPGELSRELLETLRMAFDEAGAARAEKEGAAGAEDEGAARAEDEGTARAEGEGAAGAEKEGAGTGSIVIEVRGEEDLAALPAIVAAPLGSSIVYGQPGTGMVRVAITPEQVTDARALLRGMDGDVDAALAALGVTTD